MDIEISTLNLCLGLQAKKNLVKGTILSKNIDILCMQESEINVNLDHNLLSFPGYLIETESNSQSSRVAFYINKQINYIRRRDLEGRDSNIVMCLPQPPSGSRAIINCQAHLLANLNIPLMYSPILWNNFLKKSEVAIDKKFSF